LTFSGRKKEEKTMADWMGWLVAAGVLVILELFTGTFYLLMIAIGLAVGGIVAVAGAAGPVQTIAAAAVGVLATALLRVTVPGWDNGRARVMYRGALWDVELGQGATPQAGDFRIVEVQGSRLVVANG
jgi:membrane protein implicated in regulation of membrane protease activity